MERMRLLSTLLLLSTSLILFGPLSAHAEEDAQRWSKNPAWADDSQSRETERPKKSSDREFRSRYTPFSPGSNNLSLDVGQIFLFGDLGDQFTDSIGFQLRNVHAVSEMFGLDTALAFSSHGPATSETSFSMANLKLGLRTNLMWYDKAIPYVTAGLGFFRPNYEQNDGTSLNTLLFGLHLGAGVNLEVSRSLFFGGSLTFHDMFGTRKRNAAGQLQELDGSFASFLVSAGVSF
jgi:opacity protein-like surface antigen